MATELRFKLKTDKGLVLEVVPGEGGTYLWLGDEDGNFVDAIGPAGLRALRDELTRGFKVAHDRSVHD